jgi:hypothetical protein
MCRIASKRRYEQSAKGREVQQRYNASTKGRDRASTYDWSTKGITRRVRAELRAAIGTRDVVTDSDAARWPKTTASRSRANVPASRPAANLARPEAAE